MNWADAFVLACLLFKVADQVCIVRICDRYGVAVDTSSEDAEMLNVHRWTYEGAELVNEWPLRRTVRNQQDLAEFLVKWTEES